MTNISHLHSDPSTQIATYHRLLNNQLEVVSFYLNRWGELNSVIIELGDTIYYETTRRTWWRSLLFFGRDKLLTKITLLTNELGSLKKERVVIKQSLRKQVMLYEQIALDCERHFPELRLSGKLVVLLKTI